VKLTAAGNLHISLIMLNDFYIFEYCCLAIGLHGFARPDGARVGGAAWVPTAKGKNGITEDLVFLIEDWLVLSVVRISQ
jgi:hypothetical protein